MQSIALTVEGYLGELSAERNQAIRTVREVIVSNLPAGITESMNWGMITYEVPLSVVPHTYNGQPLSYAALASQKNHMAVYLSGIYANPELYVEFERRYRETGLRMDLGKSCVRFRKIEQLPLELIGWAIGAMSMQEFVKIYQQAQSQRSSKGSRVN